MSRSRSIRAALTLAALLICGVVFMPRLYSDPMPKPADEGFASNRTTAPTVPFDGERAMGYLREICKLGPRISGSEGMKKQQELIQKHFEKLGAKVSRQEFQGKQNSQPSAVAMTNLIITWHPERERRVLICCHYDTRPIADQEPDPRKWTQTFVSANDGASSVAWMMELGNHMATMKPTVGIDFVIFDGEEFVFDNRRGTEKYFFGSEHFANNYSKSPPKHKYIAGVLLDLIAGPDAKYPYEVKSLNNAGAVIRDIWTIAHELQVPAFVPEYGPEVEDDHIALNRVGIPTVDIIDFNYPHWHRLSDTPENCSAKSMTQLAKVLTTWAIRVK